MTNNRVDITLVKLGAVLIVVLTLRNFADYAFYFTGNPFGEGGLVYTLIAGLILQLVIPLSIAGALWRYPNLITGSLAPHEPIGADSAMSAENLLLVGVSLIGLYTLVFGVIDLLYFEAYRMGEAKLFEEAEYPEIPVSPQSLAGRITNIVQILFGAALLFGRRGLTDMIMKVRTAGTRSD